MTPLMIGLIVALELAVVLAAATAAFVVLWRREQRRRRQAEAAAEAAAAAARAAEARIAAAEKAATEAKALAKAVKAAADAAAADLPSAADILREILAVDSNSSGWGRARTLLLEAELAALGKTSPEDTAAERRRGIDAVTALAREIADAEAQARRQAREDEIREMENSLTYYRERMENLEAFRNLYLQQQEEVEKLLAENERLKQEIEAASVGTPAEERIRALLTQMRSNDARISASLQTPIGTAAPSIIVVDGSDHAAEAQLAKSEQERARLAELFQHQQVIVADLRQKFQSSRFRESTVQEKLDHYQSRMEKLEKINREMNYCVRTLEEAVQRTNHRSNLLEDENKRLKKTQAEVPFLKQMMDQFTKDSRQMMDCIRILEDENRGLYDRLSKAEKLATDAGGRDADTLRRQLSDKDSELNRMRKEFSEMEKALLKMSRSKVG